MTKNECVNCGNVFGANERKCKYCGTANEQYVSSPVLIEREVESSLKKLEPEKAEKGGSVFVFFVLLCCCWPIAILYAIINFRK